MLEALFPWKQRREEQLVGITDLRSTTGQNSTGQPIFGKARQDVRVPAIRDVYQRLFTWSVASCWLNRLQIELMMSGRHLQAQDLNSVRQQTPATGIRVLGGFPGHAGGRECQVNEWIAVGIRSLPGGIHSSFLEDTADNGSCDDAGIDGLVMGERKSADVCNRGGGAGNVSINQNPDP